MTETTTCAAAARAVHQYPEYQAQNDVDGITLYITHRAGLDWGPGAYLPDVYVVGAGVNGGWDMQLDTDEARLVATALLGQDIDAMQAVVDAAIHVSQDGRTGPLLHLDAMVDAYLASKEANDADQG